MPAIEIKTAIGLRDDIELPGNNHCCFGFGDDRRATGLHPRRHGMTLNLSSCQHLT